MVKIMKNTDEIEVKCKGGGSIVDKTTLFSPDGLYLYVPWKNILRCYSVETGEKNADYDDLSYDIICVRIHPLNPKLLVGCSKKGEVVVWQSGILITKYQITACEVFTFHLVVQEDKTCLILLSYLLSSIYYVSTFSMNDCQLKTHLPFKQKLLALDVGGGGGTGCNQFMAAVVAKRLFYMELRNSSSGSSRVIRCKSERRVTFTCLACHPQENCVATGDSMGRVTIWREFMGKNMPMKTLYHWHTLPVNVVAFSYSGSVLYSGGDECVLVKWELDGLHKDYLPRLPASIRHLSSSPGNVSMAMSLSNNNIHIIDAKLRVKQVIQHFTWPVSASAGLKLDSRTKSLVCNGNVGNLQFYSPHTMSFLYNLDIVDQNKLTGERKLDLPNTNVNKIALTKLGDWLACVEEREDNNDTYPEIRLKFFHFDSTTQMFFLNTSVEYPHENGVNGLEFQPTCNSTDILCATSGNDEQFKIWSLVDTTDIYRISRAWSCLSTGYYKNFPANAISFSTDGSLIAVAFGPCLTVWSPDTCDLKCSLVHPNFKSQLRNIQFGNVDQCHLVVTTTSVRLCVWNLLTLALVWTVPLRITQLCMDPLSTYMAAFTKTKLYIFTPASATPVYCQRHTVTTNQITGASFVPHKADKTDGFSWQRMSQLYFINTQQELLCLESKNQQSSDVAMMYSTTPEKSTFDAFLAEARTSSKTDDTNLNSYMEMGLVRATQINQLLEPPIHTMAPMRFLCNSVLRSLIMKKNNHKDSTAQDDDVEESDEEFAQTDSDSESEKNKRITPNIKSKAVERPAEINKASLKAILAEPLNWTFNLLD